MNLQTVNRVMYDIWKAYRLDWWVKSEAKGKASHETLDSVTKFQIGAWKPKISFLQ